MLDQHTKKEKEVNEYSRRSESSCEATFMREII